MATSSDPYERAQDVKRCQLCPGKDRKSAAETVCKTCQLDLCKDCVGHHMISNPTIRHDVVTFEFKKSEVIPPQCIVHSEKQCEMFCEQCDCPICQKCLASGFHEDHNVPHISVFYSSKQELIRKDLNELETTIAPVYESILADMKEMSSNIEQKHEERQGILDGIGKTWHKLVDNVIKKYQSDARKMEIYDVNAMKNLEAEFRKNYSLIQSTMDENKSILALNDPSKLVNYTSEIKKFRTIPSRFELTVSEFTPKELTEQALCQIIGDIPETKKTCIEGQVLKAPQSNSSSEKAVTVKKILDLPLTVRDINATFITESDEKICDIVCIPHTYNFWVGYSNGILRQMNKEGEVLREIIILKKNETNSLTVTREGHLVYTDKMKRSINKVEGDKVKCLFKVKDWTPDAICSTSTDDLLVLMTPKYTRLSTIKSISKKIVCYSGSTVTKEINIKGEISLVDFSLLSFFVPHIDENKNLDIVLSEETSVLVMNNKGQSRFKYEGMKNKIFTPQGITTDRMCHILIADGANNIIHIIDQNGKFLQYIDNCDLHKPWDLSIDRDDILYVAESYRVKQIKYME